IATDQRLLIVNPDGTGGLGDGEVQEVPLDQISTLETHEFHGLGTLEIGTDHGGTQEIPFSRSLVDKFAEARAVLEDAVKQLRPDGPEEDEEEEKRHRPTPKPRCTECGRTLPPGADRCPACIKKGALLVRIVQYVKPYWHLSLASFLLSVGLTLLELTPPLLFALLIDRALTPGRLPTSERYSTLWMLVGILAAVYVVRAFMTGARTLTIGWLSQRIMFDVRTEMFEHLQKLSLAFYDKRSLGSIMSRVTNDTSVINGFVATTMPEFLLIVIKLVLIGVILFTRNTFLAVLVLLPALPLAWMSRWFRRTIRPVWRKYWQQQARISTVLASSINGVRVVKGFAQEQRENRRFRSRMHDFLRVNMRTIRIRMIYFPAVALVSAVGSIIIWVVGAPMVIQGALTIGELTLFMSYMWSFYQPIGQLAEIQNTIQQTATAAERVFEVLDIEPEIRDRADAKDLPRIDGHIKFENVHFRYESQEPGEYVLKDINLEAHPGELIGLVGHSGSGKSTLVNLLQRFYDVTDGSITIDGHDVRDVRLKSLRQQTGIVLQEAFLFSGTIAENIAYGRPDATREEIVAAAKAANAHRFIVRFPDGYDTEVGERGVRLSGGEKQRISIARAILNNPRLMILDEATSAVDTETEQLIQEALDRVMQDRTVFAIAHRLSTLKNASKLIVMDKGQIAEVGTHEELMEKEDGIYRKLVQIQTDLSQNVVLHE
ncbi:MAG: ABC transporter ATP-binding protein/permease, partial [Armatimonadetes bacterium]|nr:ABC transporter ATP-binding protein/permease [Armatimonadota bacterium]